MVTKRATTEVSADKLLEAASQLSLPELEWFVEQVVEIQTQRRALSTGKTEAELLEIINQRGLPKGVRRRYYALIRKRQSENITEEEYAELLHLTDQSEYLGVAWLEALIALANLRNVSLDELMTALDIKPLPVL